MSNPDPQQLRPAATVILMREREDAPPELLMIERARTMVFAGGAMVFPGGGVDSADFAFAERLAGNRSESTDDLAARIAAIRETIEETGVAIGLDPAPDPTTLATIRNALAMGENLAALLDGLEIQVVFDALSPFARWIPLPRVTRAFDTRFYVAAAPDDAFETVDGGETVRLLWTTAEASLAAAETGEQHIVFPTRCNLIRLAQFSSLAEAVSDGAAYGHHIASGRIEVRDGVEWICLDEGIGYPVTALPMDSVPRG